MRDYCHNNKIFFYISIRSVVIKNYPYLVSRMYRILRFFIRNCPFRAALVNHITALCEFLRIHLSFYYPEILFLCGKIFRLHTHDSHSVISSLALHNPVITYFLQAFIINSDIFGYLSLFCNLSHRGKIHINLPVSLHIIRLYPGLIIHPEIFRKWQFF